MATSTTTRHVLVSSSTPNSRSNEKPLPSNSTNRSYLINTRKEPTNSLGSMGIPVKFADNLFSTLVRDQVNQFLNIPRIKELHYTEENTARTVTYEITEIIKRIVAQHIKDNYKAVIQVMTYPKQDENNILIMSRCLWNYRTDDVLSVEIETDAFKYLIVIHGVTA